MIYCNYKYAFKEKTKNSPMCDFCLYVYIWQRNPTYTVAAAPAVLQARILQEDSDYSMGLCRQPCQARLLWEDSDYSVGLCRQRCARCRIPTMYRMSIPLVLLLLGRFRLFYGTMQAELCKMQDSNHVQNVYSSAVCMSRHQVLQSAEYSQCLLVFREKCIIHTEQLCTVQRLKGQ